MALSRLPLPAPAIFIPLIRFQQRPLMEIVYLPVVHKDTRVCHCCYFTLLYSEGGVHTLNL